MTRQLTIIRKKQLNASTQSFNVGVDGQLVYINMSDRRPVRVNISEDSHVVTFDHIIRKRNPEPTVIPAGTENVTVIPEVKDQKLFSPGKWVTSVEVG